MCFGTLLFSTQICSTANINQNNLITNVINILSSDMGKKAADVGKTVLFGVISSKNIKN